jgi:predicted ester cyclase
MTPADESTTTTEPARFSLEDLVASYLAVWNGADPKKLDRILAPDFRRIADPMSESAQGVDGATALVHKMRLDMPDLTTVVIDAFYDGERAVVRWRLSGTDSGPGDWPPTGKRCDATGFSLFRERDGRLFEEITIADAVTLLAQLGWTLMPPEVR